MPARARPEGRASAVTRGAGVLAAAALAAFAAGAGLAGCRDATPDPRPNLLLVTLDTTRFDHTSVAGYARDTTPRLAALAREGASFELAYAPTSTTGPTHATLFTGLSPLSHGVLKNGVPLDASRETLTERLAGLGWRTGAFVSSFVVSRRFGFDQGFDAYDDRFERATSTYTEEFWEGQAIRDAFDRRGNATTERALQWLEANAGHGPLFAWVHYFDPHAPYVPPEGFAGRFAPAPEGGALARDVARYDEEIAFADAELGRLLDALERLGLAGNTIVAVTADHGEGLMDHGHMEHGVHIYEEQVRVPLVLRWPGRIVPTRVGEPVELADLRPTLEALLGLEPAASDGWSLGPALAGGAALDPERPVHLYRRHFAGEKRGDTFVRGEKFGLRVGRWKLIDGPEEGTRELFDLVADPGERENRADAAPDVVAELGARIASWRAGRAGVAGAALQVTPEEREQLRALGYTE